MQQIVADSPRSGLTVAYPIWLGISIVLVPLATWFSALKAGRRNWPLPIFRKG